MGLRNVEVSSKKKQLNYFDSNFIMKTNPTYLTSYCGLDTNLVKRG